MELQAEEVKNVGLNINDKDQKCGTSEPNWPGVQESVMDSMCYQLDKDGR